MDQVTEEKLAQVYVVGLVRHNGTNMHSREMKCLEKRIERGLLNWGGASHSESSKCCPFIQAACGAERVSEQFLLVVFGSVVTREAHDCSGYKGRLNRKLWWTFLQTIFSATTTSDFASWRTSSSLPPKTCGTLLIIWYVSPSFLY